MNATKSGRRGEHAHVFPIEFFLLLTLDKHSGQAVGDAFPCVHPFLDVRKHTAVNLQEITVKLLSASVRLSGNPLQRFDEVDKVREWACELLARDFRLKHEPDLPVRSLNSIAIERIRSMSGSEVESVRIANDRVNILLRRCQYKVRLERGKDHLLQGIATSVMSRADRSSTVLGFLIQGAKHDAAFVVEGMVISRDGLWSHKLSSNLPVVPPTRMINTTNS